MTIRPIASLGMFIFSPAVGSYEEFEERWKFIWAKPDPIGSAPLKQWMGKGDNVITIRGGIWPEIQPAGTMKMEAMAAVAGLGLPFSFRLGNGMVKGQWCIEELSKKSSDYFSDIPSSIEFEIKMSIDIGSDPWPL